MYSITINGTQTLKTNLNTSNKEFEGTLNDAIVKGNFEKINPYQYHFLMNNRSFNVDVVKVNSEEKTLVVKINSVYVVSTGSCALLLASPEVPVAISN